LRLSLGGCDRHSHVPEDERCNPLPFADEPQEEMLGADIVMPHGPGFGDSVFEDLLGLGGEGDLTRGAHLGPDGDDLFHLSLQGRDVHAELLQDGHCETIPLPDETEEEMLRPDKVVSETDRLFPGQDDYLPRPFGKTLKHTRLLSRTYDT
jgi:hypothetical protein